jgi:predicted transcriptional regulator
MTYQIQITPELKARLDALAAREGTTADAVAVRTLEQHLPRLQDREALLKMLREWQEENALAPEDDSFFIEMDKHRSSYRKLYPPELKGITW